MRLRSLALASGFTVSAIVCAVFLVTEVFLSHGPSQTALVNAGFVSSAGMAVCGNGIMEGAEECDVGNGAADTCGPDSCLSTDCVCEQGPGGACGNGVVDASEDCDDGNAVNGDGCSSFCNAEAPAEANLCGACVNEDDCASGLLCIGQKCRLAGGPTTSCPCDVCGGPSDALTCANANPALTCIAVAADGGARCRTNAAMTCAPAPASDLCGNLVVDPGEECDNGAFNYEEESDCGPDCRFRVPGTGYCGDGIVQRPREQCDGNNADCPAGQTCRTCACVPPPGDPAARNWYWVFAPVNPLSTGLFGIGPVPRCVRDPICRFSIPGIPCNAANTVEPPYDEPEPPWPTRHTPGHRIAGTPPEGYPPFPAPNAGEKACPPLISYGSSWNYPKGTQFLAPGNRCVANPIDFDDVPRLPVANGFAVSTNPNVTYGYVDAISFFPKRAQWYLRNLLIDWSAGQLPDFSHGTGWAAALGVPACVNYTGVGGPPGGGLPPGGGGGAGGPLTTAQCMMGFFQWQTNMLFYITSLPWWAKPAAILLYNTQRPIYLAAWVVHCAPGGAGGVPVLF